ncbi:MAG: hypothetical protein P4N41_15725 [Negativicutes bacterium]|nr:hypothetical protein [Negativicutes bacterium]MDR3591103.1 hypothetical protein [Negativicutes bacterium]
MALGDLSAKYESNGDPGAVADSAEDAGGASYGAYQFATNAGVPQDFVDWLLRQDYSLVKTLTDAGAPGTQEFDAAWRQVAQEDHDGFLELQRQYVQQKYYQPAVDALSGINFNVDGRSEALRQVVWSAAVQYGPGWVAELFKEASAGDPNQCDDATLITKIYEVRASDDWTSGSPELRPSLRDRFASECDDALAMLA